MHGYYASLKSCMAGLVLVSDMTVSAFCMGGELVNLMCAAGDYPNVDQMIRDSQHFPDRGLPHQRLAKIEDALKNMNVKLVHLNHRKKIKGFGPPANVYRFCPQDHDMTIQQYYEEKAASNPAYRQYMPTGRLKYPSLPTVKVGGTKKEPALVPAEFCLVPSGQTRNRCQNNGEIVSQLIKLAAAKPGDRFGRILDDAASAMSEMRRDGTAQAFGLGTTCATPMAVRASILPQAILQYGTDTVDPGLQGSWNMRNNRFVKSPEGIVKYGILVVGASREDWQRPVQGFAQGLERDASIAGMNLRNGARPLPCSDHEREIMDCLLLMHTNGAMFALVILISDSYSTVKFVSDTLGFPTQCIRWKNVLQTPRGFCGNVMLKVNTKLGGTNHTLISRLPPNARPPQGGFQDPPASISWLFDEPCMLMGVDVTHPDPGHDGPSMAAVVSAKEAEEHGLLSLLVVVYSSLVGNYISICTQLR